MFTEKSDRKFKLPNVEPKQVEGWVSLCCWGGLYVAFSLFFPKAFLLFFLLYCTEDVNVLFLLFFRVMENLTSVWSLCLFDGDDLWFWCSHWTSSVLLFHSIYLFIY